MCTPRYAFILLNRKYRGFLNCWALGGEKLEFLIVCLCSPTGCIITFGTLIKHPEPAINYGTACPEKM